MIKSFDSKLFGKLNVEFYGSAQEMANDLEVRKVTSSSFKADPYRDSGWVGANREETFRMLREGYQPTVDAMKQKVKFTASGSGKRFRSFNDVVGHTPIIPNAIMGLPNSMVNSRMTPIKTKVLDVYYEMTCSASTESDDLIKAGQKILGAILEMEAQGYRFNLYCTQGYYNEQQGCDMVCVKVKSANQPMDLKRMSFPISHTAFFRGIGFDWYSKFPLGQYRPAYGHSIFYDKSQSEIQDEYRRLFGKSAFCFSAATIIRKADSAEEYIKGVLTNG